MGALLSCILTCISKPVIIDPPMDILALKTSTHGSAIYWEGEACEILRASTSAEEIQLVCCYFPFQHPDTPLDILSSRRIENSFPEWRSSMAFAKRIILLQNRGGIVSLIDKFVWPT